ncbi:MAG: Fic family protein [Simkaniaceae bacterium]|nr:Fic family protein [Simkaniaceae bacterium]
MRTIPGTALKNNLSGKVIYTPPEGEKKLRDLLTNWQEYIHADDGVDPLIKLAVQHYQFEAIHPFTDGNGRTGRILNLLYLIKQDLLDSPILYMSGYILQHRARYYRLLSDVTAKGRWIDWIVFMVLCVEETAKRTATGIRSIQDLMEETETLIREHRLSLRKGNITELLFMRPYVRVQDLRDMEGIGRDTASAKLKALCDLDILREVVKGRHKLFVNEKLLHILRHQE